MLFYISSFFVPLTDLLSITYPRMKNCIQYYRMSNLQYCRNIIIVVNDWNRIVVQFTGSITEYLNTDSVLNLLSKQFHLKDTPSAASNTLDTSVSDSTILNKGPPKSLLWNSKRPITIDTSIKMIKTTDFKDRNADKDRNNLNLMGPIKSVPRTGLGAILGEGNDLRGQVQVHDISKPTAVSGFVAFEELSKPSSSLVNVKSNKNKIPDKSPTISTTLLNNITKKPVKSIAVDINTTKIKSPSPSTSTTPSAFTSYLQDLMD